MYTQLPAFSEAFESLNWSEIEPWYIELTATPLSQKTVQPWLAQWSLLSELVEETVARHEIACTQNTANQECVQRKLRFLNDIYTMVQIYDQQLKQLLLTSNLEPEGFTISLRNLRSEAALYCEANLPLLNEEQKMNVEYMQMGGAQTVRWQGKEVNITTLRPVFLEPDRELRERAWRIMNERQLADREKLNALWAKGIQLRQQIAQNANYENYRDYRWRQLLRFDYTPTDCLAFHQAVEQVVVPAATAVWEKRRKLLGVETLRPWDIHADPRGIVSPRLSANIQTILQQCATAIGFIDAQLQSYFQSMIQEHLIDFENRSNKSNRGYNIELAVTRRPFIFGSAQTIWDIVTLFHEAGHAFQVFEMSYLPYLQQRKESYLPLEFAEVASTTMEFLGTMYLHQAGFCTPSEQAQLRIQHLERTVTQLFPLAARGDAFQHWVYEYPEQAMNPGACDQKWVELSQRYLPYIDWSGLDAEQRVEWQQVRHFYGWPFYYIEYALAALGALQVWDNYLRDPQTAMQRYRYALSLGATRTVPELFAAAGATFAFDTQALQKTVHLITHTIEELEYEI